MWKLKSKLSNMVAKHNKIFLFPDSVKKNYETKVIMYLKYDNIRKKTFLFLANGARRLEGQWQGNKSGHFEVLNC